MIVIPAKVPLSAGFFQVLRNSLDTGFHSPRKRLPQRAGETTFYETIKFEFRKFGFVSDFDILISDFFPPRRCIVRTLAAGLFWTGLKLLYFFVGL
jgi:hypothetical protein